MPELPEVETIRRGLAKYLIGRRLVQMEIRLPKMVSGDSTLLQNAVVKDVRRFGKGLIIDFDNAYSLAIHIKMTGQLLYQGKDIPQSSKPHPLKVGILPGPHTHVIIRFDGKDSVYYNDIRQFGWFKILSTDKVGEVPFFKELGPEPLGDLTYEKFAAILTKRKGQVKPLLMDQKVIAGVGNIYANDALYLAKIHPKRSANSLSDKETQRLFDAIETVLKKGLAVGGASEWQYVNVLGETGNYQDFFQVYGKVGQACSVCGEKIIRENLAGRGTFYCPGCQK